MLGVVLWSDVSDRKAVIWCEDQGDLAYVNAEESLFQTDDFFDAGDLVQFDMEMCKSMRRANNPRLVIGKAGPALPEVLRQGAGHVSAHDTHANIIPFTPKQPMQAPG